MARRRWGSRLIGGLVVGLLLGGGTAWAAQDAPGFPAPAAVPGQLPESERQRLYALMDAAPDSVSPQGYNPLVVIRIVNALQPLGKDAGLDVMWDYLRARQALAVSHLGLLLVLRALADIPRPSGHLSPFSKYGRWKGPRDPRRAPMYPLLLVEDVPLMIGDAHAPNMYLPPVTTRIQEFRTQGTWRAEPLHPSTRPVELLSRAEALSAWVVDDVRKKYGRSSGEDTRLELRERLWTQLCRMEDALYPDPRDRHYTLDQQLVRAVVANNQPEVRRLLDRGASPDAWDVQERPVLSLAAPPKRRPIFRLLVERGADLLGKGSSDLPLHAAAAWGNVETVRFLLDLGVPAGQRDKHGYTATMAAAGSGSPECLELVLDRGGPVRVTSDTGQTALMRASDTGSLECVQMLLARGERARVRSKDGESPLLEAVAFGKNLEVIRVLLEHGADPNVHWKQFPGLLHEALDIYPSGPAYVREAIRLLLAHGAHPEMKNWEGTTARSRALESGDAELAELFRNAKQRK